MNKAALPLVLELFALVNKERLDNLRVGTPGRDGSLSTSECQQVEITPAAAVCYRLGGRERERQSTQNKVVRTCRSCCSLGSIFTE